MAEEAPTVASVSTTEGNLSLTPNLEKIGKVVVGFKKDGTPITKMTLEEREALLRRATVRGTELLLPKKINGKEIEPIVAVFEYARTDNSKVIITCTAIGYLLFVDSYGDVDIAVIAVITQQNEDGSTTVLEKRQFLSSTAYFEGPDSRRHYLHLPGHLMELQFTCTEFSKSVLQKINEYFLENVYIPMVLVAAKLEGIKENARVRQQRSRKNTVKNPLREHFEPYLKKFIDLELGLKITRVPLLKLKAFQGLMNPPAFYKGDLNQTERERAWNKAIDNNIIVKARKIINNNTNDDDDDDDDRKPAAVPSPTDANNNNNNAAPPSAPPSVPPSAQANAAAPPTNDANAQMARLEASMATIIADIEALKIGAAAAAPSTNVNAHMATNAAPSSSTDVASSATTTVSAAAAASSTAAIMKSDSCDIAGDDIAAADDDDDDDDDYYYLAVASRSTPPIKLPAVKQTSPSASTSAPMIPETTKIAATATTATQVGAIVASPAMVSATAASSTSSMIPETTTRPSSTMMYSKEWKSNQPW